MPTKFDPKNHYVLENEWVLLRPLEPNDIENLRPFSQNEPDIWQYSMLKMQGEENLKNYFKHSQWEKEKGNHYPFIVWDKKQQAYAGSTRFYNISVPNNTMELGYTWYGKNFAGTGLNKQCKYLLLQFAFEQVNMHRIQFMSDANNARSIAAMKSIGCVVDGFLREHSLMPNGEYRTSIILSILQQEWVNDVKKMLGSKIGLR
jgi:N-acetyltransferase